jgi:DNA-binding CsgD family transcriptional regulator
VSLAEESTMSTVSGVLGLVDVAIAERDWQSARRFAVAAAMLIPGSPDDRWQALILTRQGAVAAAQGDRQEALSVYRRALKLWHGIGPAPAVADCLEAIAGLLADGGSLDQAARLLAATQAFRDQREFVRTPQRRGFQEAVVAAVRSGLGPAHLDTVWAEGARLAVGEAVAYATRGSGGRARGDTGWDSLTGIEVEIAALVAQGLTNREIGERLFNSPRTVERHITHALAKLGMTSRRELGREWLRRSRSAAVG